MKDVWVVTSNEFLQLVVVRVLAHSRQLRLDPVDVAAIKNRLAICHASRVEHLVEAFAEPQGVHAWVSEPGAVAEQIDHHVLSRLHRELVVASDQLVVAQEELNSCFY